jgi:sulfane dehydrogenase subunit SoxC
MTVASAGEGITLEELALAARNHGMPLEALRYDVTPVGLHYLLIHYDIPDVDVDSWVLTVDGSVARPLRVSLTDLRALPATSHTVTMECAGNGRARLDPRPISQPWLYEAVGTARWTGARLVDLLDQAGVDGSAVEVLFTGLDRGLEGALEQSYQRSLPLDEARRADVIVAYEMNGGPLLPQHGAPARLVVPGWYGMTHVKWLGRITLVDEPFTGYQQDHSYRIRRSAEEPGDPVTRILPRSLMTPPGIPDFLSRDRLVDAGIVGLSGRAWSGLGPVVSVEVSTDGARTWAPARLEEPVEPYAWQAWSFEWIAGPGDHVLCSRATDATGHTQPLDAEWNLGGYQVNAVHRLRVAVRV